ncbi:MAG: hypothetical protein ACI8S6_004714 [Myxococcota bacterium]|jgi:hypothetical protein
MMHAWTLLLLSSFACKAPDDSGLDADPFVFAALTERPSMRGPGGPVRSFDEEELWQNCASITGGEEDVNHHNLVVPYRGHLVLPWAPEWSRGGLSFFEVDDPCQPVKVGEGFHERMRESHAVGFTHLPEDDPYAGDYAAVTGIRGIQIWDVTDERSPEAIAYLEIEDVFYPDAYARVVLSVFWQYPWLYIAAADNGLYVVDTTDPADPQLVNAYPIEPALRASGVFVMGTLMLVTSAEGTESVLLDVSDPVYPQPIGGGRFTSVDENGDAWEAYHANIAGDLALYARKENGGGLMVMDISDPSSPQYAGDYTPGDGNGGYVFYDEGFAFVGLSSYAAVYDMRDLSDITEVGRGYLPGDLDTITPYGNVAILSVDDDSVDDIASAIMPWTTDPDTSPPTVLRVVPADGAVGIATTARIGVGFDEMIEPSSSFAGSIRLYADDGEAIDGWGSGQESVASYVPKAPLRPATTYRVEILAEGITDINGNALAETVTTTFTTAGP